MKGLPFLLYEWLSILVVHLLTCLSFLHFAYNINLSKLSWLQMPGFLPLFLFHSLMWPFSYKRHAIFILCFNSGSWPKIICPFWILMFPYTIYFSASQFCEECYCYFNRDELEFVNHFRSYGIMGCYHVLTSFLDYSSVFIAIL